MTAAFFVGTKWVTETEFFLGEDARCSLRRIVGGRPFCDRPAEWAVRLGCCGHIKVVCIRHHLLPEAIAPAMLICARCKTPRPPVVSSWPV